jgi:nucleoside-diphosphate-sugar epimerase
MSDTLRTRGPLVVIGADGWIGSRVLARSSGVAIGVARRPAPGSDHLAAPDLVALRQVLTLSSPSVVVNCAGTSHGDAVALRDANVALVAGLVDMSSDLGARLVHLGSAAEYGDPGPVPVAETSPCRPVSPYAVSKLLATEIVLAARAGGFDAVVLRPFNIIGPGHAPAGPVSELVKAVQALPPAGGELVLGNAAMVRDYVSLDFVADVVLAAATRPVGRPVLNVCSGRGLSLGDLAVAVAAAAGRTASVRSRDWPVLPSVVGDPSLLRTELGLESPDSPTALAHAALGLAPPG